MTAEAQRAIAEYYQMESELLFRDFERLCAQLDQARPTPARVMTAYTEIPADWVDPALRAEVADVVASVAPLLEVGGLLPIDVRWITIGTGPPGWYARQVVGDLAGQFSSDWPRTIFLRADLAPREVKASAAHELHHLAMYHHVGRHQTRAEQVAAIETREAEAETFTLALYPGSLTWKENTR